MKLLKAIILTIVLFSFSGFKIIGDSEITGVFGISKIDAPNLELRLNPDKTFTYIFLSGKGTKENVSGNWELKNNTIILNNYTSAVPFHTKWKMEEDGRAIRSRRGLNF